MTGHRQAEERPDTGLRIRRAVAAVIALVLVAVALTVGIGSRQAHEHKTALVAAGFHQEGTISAIDNCGRRRGCEYFLATGNRQVQVDVRALDENPEIGDPVTYVADPEDADLAVATGNPAYWAQDRDTEHLVLTVGLVLAAVAASLWLLRFISPEDLTRIGEVGKRRPDSQP